ncbi:MAG: NAD(P)H-dependent oxidoreductase [Cyclobacteriaceae bacterium]
MTTALLYGSVRSNRQGIKAALYFQQQLKDRGHKVLFIDALESPLPLLDKMYKEYKNNDAPEMMEKIASQLREADGFVVVTGEYNHGIPPALKNTLDHFQKEYFYKPSAIVSYSAGRFGGVRSAVHLRVVLAELGTPSIPTMQPIPKVGQAFTEDGKPTEDYLNKSSKRFLDEYEWYLNAMKGQRAKGLPN